jgi:class 3 adenylate cyclase/tetratricopeptide (TPR) repeat protein
MVVFCDLVGSTELSGRLEPEQYGLVIERYVSESRATFEERFGGQVVGVQGDGLLVLFGAPDAHEDDAERAVRAALAVIDVVKALSAGTQRDLGEKLAVRIAIHRGQIYRDLNAIYGLTANVTARLQQLAPPDGIVISDDVQRMIGGTFETFSIGPQLVKGVSDPIHAHHVIGERFDLPAMLPFHAPFVGRVPESERLLTMWGEVSTKPNLQVAALLLQGEAGVGKSYLAARVTRAATDKQAPVIELAGSAFFVDSGLYPVRRLIEQASGIRNDSDGSERLRLLREEMKARGLEPSEFVPLLAPVLGIEPEAGYVAEPFDTRKLSAAIADAAYLYISARLGPGPSVMLAEDLQWIDATTLEILERIARDERACMMVITARPGVPPFAGAEVIDLEPLSESESALLVDELCAETALSPGDRRSLIARSDGIPLYIEELVAAARHGMPSSVPEEATVRPSGTVPDILYDLLAARLSPHEEDIVPIASAAAVIGRDIDPHLLQSVLGMTEDEIARSLESLCEQGVLEASVEGGKPFRFRHELLREVAYELQPPSQRRFVHGRFADVLTSASDGEVIDWGDAASHFEKAGRVPAAVSSYESAASSARRRGSFSEAQRHLSRSVDLLESGLPHDLERDLYEINLRLQRGYLAVSEQGHSSPAAANDYQRCLELAVSDPAGDQWFSTVIVMWTYHLIRGEISKAQEISDLTYRSLDRREWYRSFNLASFGILECWEGNFGAAKDLLGLFDATRVSEDEERFAAEWLNPTEPVGGALATSAVVQFLTGDDTGAEKQFAASFDRLEGMDFPRGPYSAAHSLTHDAWMRLELGQFEEAEERITRLTDIATRHGFDSWSMVAQMQTTVLAALRSLSTGSASKESAEYAAVLDSMIEIWRAFDTRYFLPYYLTTAGLLHAAGGDKRLAHTRLEESLRLAEETAMHFYDGETLRHLANLELHPEGREQGLREALALTRAQHAGLFELRVAIDLTQLCGEAERTNLEAALQNLEGGSRYPEMARARLVLERLG